MNPKLTRLPMLEDGEPPKPKNPDKAAVVIVNSDQLKDAKNEDGSPKYDRETIEQLESDRS